MHKLFILSVALMKIIPETCHVHYIRFLRFYDYHWVETSDGGLLVPEVIIFLVGSASTWTWFFRDIFYTNLQIPNHVIIIKTN